MSRPIELRIAIVLTGLIFLPILILSGWGSLLNAQASSAASAQAGINPKDPRNPSGLKPDPGDSQAGGEGGSVFITYTVQAPALESLHPIYPGVFNGDLRDVPPSPESKTRLIVPLRLAPGEQRKAYVPQLADWVDPLLQQFVPQSQMPSPAGSYPGMSLYYGGLGWPPDTNGDVGPDYYMQTVNTSVAIYDKATGQELWRRTINQFFQLTSDLAIRNTPCYDENYGDPILLYDPYVQRWVVTDFAFSSLTVPPFYQCLAVSQTSDPLTGGWYFYAMRADTGSFYGYVNDYPKLGVWSDGWYLSANMFQEVSPWTGFGVRLWALDRQAMIAGQALREVHFDLCWDGVCESLLPANLRGNLPPTGSPEYFLAVGNDALQLWRMSIDWNNLTNSTLSGPVSIPVEQFAVSASVPQPNSLYALDSLGPRLMHPLQYRMIDGQESLWANHTVSNAGIPGIRWYELGNLSSTPSLLQQGTFQPDNLSRWMGSLAVDQDGNMALGYSVSSSSVFPGIRYTGRLAGELPGTLTQGETILVNGQGSQTNTYRWGDYSSMSIDPLDGCTFWYTTEYFLASGSIWQTRIGTFQFPTCGQQKGTLQGTVYNSITHQVIAGSFVSAHALTTTLTSQTNSLGVYSLDLPVGEYRVSAGPLLPGYPISQTIATVSVAKGLVTQQNFYLDPAVALVGQESQIRGGEFWADGYALPGDNNLALWRSVQNTGAVTATQVTAFLTSLSPGVQLISSQTSYPDIPTGGASFASTPYTISVDSRVSCGTDLSFQQVLTSNSLVFTDTFPITVGKPIGRLPTFEMDAESGNMGWSPENPWSITSVKWHSPDHSWTDSPGGLYKNDMNVSLRTPVFDMRGKRNTQLSGWISYDLESGWDYLYVEYSLDGGLTWEQIPLASFTGKNTAWNHFLINTPSLDNQASVRIRFRLLTDQSVTYDGVYLDDLSLDYEHRVCYRYILPEVNR